MSDPRPARVAFRPYAAADRAALLPMIERVYDGEVRRRHEILWDWVQAAGLRSGDAAGSAIVVERDGEVAGFFGKQPRRFKIGDEVVAGAFTQDNFTDPSARGVGGTLFKRMLETHDLLLGAAVPRATRLWHRIHKRDDLTVFRVVKAKRLVDPAAFLPRRVRALAAPAARLAWAGVDAAFRLRAPRLRGAAVEAVDRFPPEVDALCARWAATRRMTALRDARYLDWRYAESPLAYERRVLRQDGEVVGLSAYRVGLMNGRRVLLILELLAAHPEPERAYGSLVGEALGHARRRGVADAQVLDPGCPAVREALAGHGFFFRPEPGTTVIGSFRNDGSEDCPIYRPEDWFMSAGDSDFEFTFFRQGPAELEAARA